MELNSVDKIKLMMSYDLTKTLHENLSGKTTLNEFVSDIDEAGKASEITKGLESAKDYEQKIIAIANHFNLSTQEVRIAVSKDLTTLDKELETVIRKDANKGLRYGNTLGKNAKEVSKQLALNEIFHSTRPLTEDEIVQIIERNKQASLAKQTEIENSVTKRVGNKTEKDIKKRIENERFPMTIDGVTYGSKEELETKLKSLSNPNQTTDQAIKAIDDNKGTVDSATIEEDKEKVKENKGWIRKGIDKIKDKLSWQWLFKLGLVGYGGYKLYRWLSKGDNTPNYSFGQCIFQLEKYGAEGNENNGNYIVTLTKTGTAEYDSHGGLIFHAADGDHLEKGGLVTYGDLKRKGTWFCESNIAKPQQTNEETLNEELLNEFKADPSKFGQNLNNDVHSMIRLLDFPVYGDDLKNALQLLTIYRNNGQGKEFLDRYQKSGLGGGDLEKTLDYVVAIKPESVELKDKLLNMAKEMKSGVKTTGDPLKDLGIRITWEGDNQNQQQQGQGDTPNPKPQPEQVTYKDCTDFPFDYGCRNLKIKEMQTCLGFEQRYQTGNFGPITKQALGGVQQITLDLYNETMKKCQQTPTQGTTDTTSGSTTGDTTTTTGSTTGNTTSSETQQGLASMVDTTQSRANEGNPPTAPQTPEEQAKLNKGKELYQEYYDNYQKPRKPKPFVKIDPLNGRLKYKGNLLSDTDLNALNAYIKSLGYTYMSKQKRKEYGHEPEDKDEKYVWEPSQQAQSQSTQQPKPLQEQRIKNIVSKHLRSRL